jgi:hypothetical protein
MGFGYKSTMNDNFRCLVQISNLDNTQKHIGPDLLF